MKKKRQCWFACLNQWASHLTQFTQSLASFPSKPVVQSFCVCTTFFSHLTLLAAMLLLLLPSFTTLYFFFIRMFEFHFKFCRRHLLLLSLFRYGSVIIGFHFFQQCNETLNIPTTLFLSGFSPFSVVIIVVIFNVVLVASSTLSFEIFGTCFVGNVKMEKKPNERNLH